MRNTRGFSLVEVICAIGLLAGVLATLAQVLAESVRTAATARFSSTATLVAQHKLEQLRGEATLEELPDGIEHLDAAGLPVCGTREPCPDAVVTVRWSIASLAIAPTAVLVHVAVSHAHARHTEVQAFAVRPRRVR